MGSGSTSRSSSMSSPRTTTPSTAGARPARCSALPRRAAKAGGMSRSCSETHASIEAFTSRAPSGLPSENETPRRSVSRKARPPSRTCHFSHSAGVRLPRPSVASSVSNTFATISSSSLISSVAGVRERTGLARPTTSLPPRGVSSAAASPGSGSEPRRLLQVGVGLRVLATEVGERRRERQQPGQHLGLARVPGQGDALLGPAARLFAASGLPRGLGREQQRDRRPGRLGELLEEPCRGRGFLECHLGVPRDPLRLRQQQPGLALESAVTLPFLVEAVESRLRGAHRLLHAEGVERRPRQAQAVVDRLLGDVPLVEVLDELRQHAVRPRCVPRLQGLPAAPVQRAPLARRQARVEHLAHDPAREAELLSPRLALLLDQALAHEPVDRVVHVGVLRERLEVARLEGPCRAPKRPRAAPAGPRAACGSASRPPPGSSPAARPPRSPLPRRGSTARSRPGRCPRRRAASAPAPW